MDFNLDDIDKLSNSRNKSHGFRPSLKSRGVPKDKSVVGAAPIERAAVPRYGAGPESLQPTPASRAAALPQETQLVRPTCVLGETPPQDERSSKRIDFHKDAGHSGSFEFDGAGRSAQDDTGAFMLAAEPIHDMTTDMVDGPRVAEPVPQVPAPATVTNSVPVVPVAVPSAPREVDALELGVQQRSRKFVPGGARARPGAGSSIPTAAGPPTAPHTSAAGPFAQPSTPAQMPTNLLEGTDELPAPYKSLLEAAMRGDEGNPGPRPLRGQPAGRLPAAGGLPSPKGSAPPTRQSLRSAALARKRAREEGLDASASAGQKAKGANQKECSEEGSDEEWQSDDEDEDTQDDENDDDATPPTSGRRSGTKAKKRKRAPSAQGALDDGGTVGDRALVVRDEAQGRGNLARRKGQEIMKLLEEEVDVERWSLRQITERAQLWDQQHFDDIRKIRKEQREREKHMLAQGPRVSGLTRETGTGRSTHAPQVMIVDGQIVLNTHSLVIQAQEQQVDTFREVEEKERYINSQTFMKIRRHERWTKADTDLFYKGLATLGPDFSAIAKLFTNRDRSHIKAKYKKEFKVNPARVEAAMKGKGRDVVEVSSLVELVKANLPPAEEEGPIGTGPTPATANAAAQDPGENPEEAVAAGAPSVITPEGLLPVETNPFALYEDEEECVY